MLIIIVYTVSCMLLQKTINALRHKSNIQHTAASLSSAYLSVSIKQPSASSTLTLKDQNFALSLEKSLETKKLDLLKLEILMLVLRKWYYIQIMLQFLES